MSDSRFPNSQSNAQNEPTPQTKGLFTRPRNLSIGVRLSLAFGTLLFLVLLVSFIAILSSSNQSETRRLSSLVQQEQVVISQMRFELGKTRDSALSFALTIPQDGFQTAFDTYSQEFNQHIKTIHELIAREQSIAAQRGETLDVNEFEQVRARLQQYTILSDDLIDLFEQRGSLKDQRGALYDSLKAFEAVAELAAELGAAQVEAETRHTLEEMLEYVVSPAEELIVEVAEHVEDTRAAIAQSVLAVGEKNRLSSMLETAHGNFNGLLGLNLAINSKSEALSAINDELSAELDKLLGQEIEEAQEALASEETADASTQSFLLLALIPIVLVAVGLPILVGRSISSPIGRLTATADRIALGDLKARVDIQSNDETGRLAHALNSMATQVSTLISSLETQVANRTSQLQAGAEVGRAATSLLNADQLLREVVYLITERFGFYHAAAFTLDRTGKYAVLRAATGVQGEAQLEQGLSLRVDGKSMVGFAITHRRPRFSFDISHEEAYAGPRLSETQSEITLPLIVSERVLGALDVQSTDGEAFDATTISILQSTADQIAIALDNANSYATAQEAIQQARALYSAAEEVGRLDTDLNDKVDAMMRAVGEAIIVDQWWVVLLDERRERLIPLSTLPGTTREDSSISIAEQPNSPAVRSALYGETFVVNDPEHDLRLAEIPFDRRAVIGKFISVPILTPRHPIGAINFGRTLEGRDMSESELRIGQSLASLAAIAIENQRLFDEMQRVLKEVDTINRHLTGEAWSMALRRAQRSGVLHISTQDTAAEEPLAEMAEAMQTRSVVLRERGVAEMTVAVPLMLRGVSIGVMHLRAPARAWDDDMAATVTRIADHVAQSVENARLLEETEVRFARERALHESTDKVRRGTDVERIVQTAAEELARHLNASRVAVRIGLDPLDESNGHNLNGETHSE